MYLQITYCHYYTHAARGLHAYPDSYRGLHTQGKIISIKFLNSTDMNYILLVGLLKFVCVAFFLSRMFPFTVV